MNFKERGTDLDKIYVNDEDFINRFLTVRDSLWLYGLNNWGELGTNDTLHRSSPVQTIASGTDWKQISCSVNNHTAAIKTDGTLWIMGSSSNGKLGTNNLISQSSPVQLAGTDWKQVDCGGFHTAAIKTDGTLWMWGHGGGGRLGTNDQEHRSSPVQTIAGGTNWKQVDCGPFHTAAIKIDGTLWMWGGGSSGKLGNGSIVNQSSPIQIAGTNWKQVACGNDHTAAIKTDGTLWTWGNALDGRLGIHDPSSNKSSPVQTALGGNDWKGVSCGSLYTAAIKFDGTLWTWGNGGLGQLGTNNILNVSTPVQTVAGGNDWKQVSSGTSHIGAVKTDGTLWMWGFNQNGRLGTNDILHRSSPVQTIFAGTTWKQVACGGAHTAAIKTDGTLWTWGHGQNGRLGNNAVADKLSPVQIAGTDWKSTSCSNSHTAAIKTDGTLWVWGWNSDGRLGTEDLMHRSSPVQTVAGGTDWRSVSCGNVNTAAIKNDGTLWMWGSNAIGQLGTNDLKSEAIPIQVGGGTDWKSVNCGNTYVAAIKTDGTLWLWGNGGTGRLGNNSTAHRSSPVQTISAGTSWAKVSCGDAHTAAIKIDGTLWTWGISTAGQLGANNTISRSSPIQTTPSNNWKDVSNGPVDVAAIRDETW